MNKTVRQSLSIFLCLTVVTGIVYPLLVTVIAYVAFPYQAHGSILKSGDKAIGSENLGQSFANPSYFWGRRSATGPFPYNPLGGSGANQGPTNPALSEAVDARIKELQDADPENKEKIPIDLVTASSSGLDPHISPAAALYQAGRVAKARGLDQKEVERMIAENTQARTIGLFGQRRVHVVHLNQSLDQLKPLPLEK